MNFTFVFTSRKCILWRDVSFLGKFVYQKEFLFSNWVFWWEVVKFYQFFRVVILQIHFRSGAAEIRNDFFFRIRIRILLQVSDLTGFGSGSTTLHQRACFGFQIAAYGFNEELFTNPPVIPKVVLKSPRSC